MRTCKQCSKLLVQKEGEYKRDFKRRKYCDQSCVHASNRRETPVRICPRCGKPIPRKPKETPFAYKARKYCSRNCVAKEYDTAPKLCPQCGTTITIKQGEKPFVYAKKTCCSVQCAALYRRRDAWVDRTCLCCGKQFRVTKSHLNFHPAKFCSVECSIATIMRGVPKTEAHKRKNSEAHKGRVFSAEHCENISKGQKKHYADPKERERARVSLLKGLATQARMGITGKSSSIERLLQDELDKQDIAYEIHLPIGGIGIPDIVFQEHMVLVEADGDYWHKLPRMMKRDVRQNAAYAKLGYTVLRFWGSEIRESPERCVDEILNVLTSRASVAGEHYPNLPAST